MHHSMLRVILLLLLFLFSRGGLHAQSTILWQGVTATSPLTISAKMAPDKLNALRIFFDDEKARIGLKTEKKTEFGKARYQVKYSINVEGNKGFEQLIDNFPQFPGDYEITISGKPASITIILEQLTRLEPIQFGEALGELIIENAGNSTITANPEQVEVKHPEFKKSMQNGIATPDGRIIFRLPAGYWSLERNGTPKDHVQLIPVHSGKRTSIKWNVIPQISVDSESAAKTRRIDIREITEEKDNVVAVRFAFPAGLTRDVPTVQQMQVFERGLNGEIIDLSTSKTPLHLVLLLDSSGSMKKDMKTAIESAVKFISRLPEDAKIEVIDFDSKAKLIKASSKAELIKEVKGIKADGATALRDTVIYGIDKLKSSPRPALVVFTDGFDANHNDTAPGSKATEKDVFAKVNSTRVPIFTIGFGGSADAATLARLADTSGGFYQAANTANLDQVFAALEETVAREFILTYRRPDKAGKGMRPVVGIAVDSSGSMGELIEKGKPGEKFALAKLALHSLIKGLPEQTLIQIQDFDTNTIVLQTLTTDRARMHKGISQFDKNGGTEVTKAVKVCLEGLLSAPTNRRYMMFLTDAAIKPGDQDKQQFERLLDRMKDEKIFSMWIGMVEDKAFQEVAERSGGVAIISKDFARLQNTINELLAKVGEPVDNSKTPLEIIWKMPMEGTPPQPVSGTGLFAMAPITAIDENNIQEASDTLQISFGDIVKLPESGQSAKFETQNSTNTAETANDLTSTSTTQDSKVRMAIPIDVKAENTACRFHLTSLELLDKLNGVDAPKDKIFAAISMTLTNRLPEQDVVVHPNGSSHPAKWISKTDQDTKVIKAIPPYLVQDIRKHLFLRWNSETVPVSPASWLLNNSLAPFNSYSLTVKPEQEIQGKLVFLVSDKDGLKIGALDYFDTAYGNLSLTIAGTPDPLVAKANVLPKSVSGKLGEAFKIEINGMTDQASPVAGATAGTHLVYRLLDITVDSRVQALLDIDAAKRMHLELPTVAGPVRRPLSMVTAIIPGGFYNKVKLAPGSANHLQQAYLIPQELARIATGTLCVDLKGKDCFIKLDPREQPAVPENRPWHAEGNGLKVRINAQGRVESLNKSKANWLIIDVTVADVEDGTATKPGNLFFLGRADLKEQNFITGARALKEIGNKGKSKGMGSFANNDEAQGTSPRIQPDSINNRLMFGANQDAVVPDGLELRFITAFKLPSNGDYLLAADNMPLVVKLNSEPLAGVPEWLMAINDEVVPTLADSFESILSSRLKQMAILDKGQGNAPTEFPVADENGEITIKAEALTPPIIAPHATVPEKTRFQVTVSIVASPIGDNAAAQTNKAAAALGGKQSQNRTFTLLSEHIPADKVCQTPFELVYVKEPGKSGGTETRVMASGLWGNLKGKEGIDLKAWCPIREIIKFTSPSGKWELFEREIKETDLAERIHSVAAFIPDITVEQEKTLARDWAEFKSDLPPDHISLWRWYAHSRIARFIVDQTTFEKRTSEKLGVTLSREKSPRLLILTGGATDIGEFAAKLDLLSVLPVVEGNEAAARAFRIANGFFVSELEAKVMKGLGVFQLWGRNQLQIIAPDGKQKSAWLKFADRKGIRESVINDIKKSKSVILFPENPATIDDQPFWSWIEIDPKTYEMIGVLETGEHGTIAGEAIIQALIPDGAAVALGFWKGIESSIWANCAFIVGGDSYEEALENTEKLMGNLGEKLGGIGDSFNVPVGDAQLDILSGKMSLAGFSSDGTYSPWDGYKGFSTGFEMGVAYYLGKARASGSN